MDLMIALQSLLFILLFVYVCLYLQQPQQTNGFSVYPILGTAPEFIKNYHRYLEWTTDVLRRCPTNTSVFRHPTTIHGVLTANPANVEHVLKSNFLNYPKGDEFRYILHDFLGRGIFNSDGDLWKIQRKTASFKFNKRSMRNFVSNIVAVEITTRLIPVLRKASETDRVLDLQDTLERFAFDNVCMIAFKVNPGCLGEGDGAVVGGEFIRAFENAAAISLGRFMHAFQFVWKIKKFFNVGSERRLKESIKTIHEFADKVVDLRLSKRNADDEDDLLSHFVGMHGENLNSSKEFLRDVIVSFILAGRDTTSSALTWFFFLVSTTPNVERKILQELETVRVRLGKRVGDTYDFEALQEMNYLQAALSEAMRLYPPVPTDTKVCQNDDVLPDGTFVAKGWFMTYSAYAMGRMESIWGEDCGEFRPERWLDEGGMWRQPASPFRFPVFHGGPRICLGREMAYLQMKCIAACVIEGFKMHVEGMDKNGKRPGYSLSLTLRMKGGLPMRVSQRCG